VEFSGHAGKKAQHLWGKEDVSLSRRPIATAKRAITSASPIEALDSPEGGSKLVLPLLQWIDPVMDEPEWVSGLGSAAEPGHK
jgi:hypothetical protein